jgi:hypothetical protein
MCGICKESLRGLVTSREGSRSTMDFQDEAPPVSFLNIS